MIPSLLVKSNRNITDFIGDIVSSNKGRSKLVSLSLARALVDRFSVPTEKVDVIELYFYSNYKTIVVEATCKVNETFVVNKDEILDFACKLYCYRCYQSLPSSTMLYITPETAVEDFFGITKVLSKDMIDTIKEHNSQITKYVIRFTEILRAMEEKL